MAIWRVKGYVSEGLGLKSSVSVSILFSLFLSDCAFLSVSCSVCRIVKLNPSLCAS